MMRLWYGYLKSFRTYIIQILKQSSTKSLKGEFMFDLYQRIILENKPVTLILGAGMTVWMGYPDFKGLYENILKMLLNHQYIEYSKYEEMIEYSKGNISRDAPSLLQSFDGEVKEKILDYIDNNFQNIDTLNKRLVSRTTFIENKKFLHLCNISKYANIMTTNYDQSYEYFADNNDIDLKNYVKLHGNLGSKKVLFQDHYEAFILDDEYKDEREKLRNVLKNHIVIYLGYSFNDKNMRFLYEYSKKENIYMVTNSDIHELFSEENLIKVKSFNHILSVLSKLEVILESRKIENKKQKYYYLLRNGLLDEADYVKESLNINVFDIGNISETEMKSHLKDEDFIEFSSEFMLVKRYDNDLKIGYKYDSQGLFINTYSKMISSHLLRYLRYNIKLIYFVNNPNFIYDQIKNYKHYYKNRYEKTLFELAKRLFSKKSLEVKYSKSIDEMFEWIIGNTGSLNFKMVIIDKYANYLIQARNTKKAKKVLLDLVENHKSATKYYVYLTELNNESKDWLLASEYNNEFFKVAEIGDPNINKMMFYKYHLKYCLAKTLDEEFEVFVNYKNDDTIKSDAVIYKVWYEELKSRGLFDEAHEMLWKAFEYDPSDKKVKEIVAQRNMGINSGDVKYRPISDNFDKLGKIWEIEKNNSPQKSENYVVRLKQNAELLDNLIIRFEGRCDWLNYFDIEFSESVIEDYKSFIEDGKMINIPGDTIISRILRILTFFNNGEFSQVVSLYQNEIKEIESEVKALLVNENLGDKDYELFLTIIGMSYLNINNDKGKQILENIESNYYSLTSYCERMLQPGFLSNALLSGLNNKLKKARRFRKVSLGTNYMQGVVSYFLGHVTESEKYLSAIRARKGIYIGKRIDIYYKLLICAIYQGVNYKNIYVNDVKAKEMDDRIKSYLFEIKRTFKVFNDFESFDSDKVKNIYGYGYFFQLSKSLFWTGVYTSNKKVTKYILDLAVYYSDQSKNFNELKKEIEGYLNNTIQIQYSLIK